MTTTRRLVRATWVTVTAMLFLFAGGTAAWAKPAPVDSGDAAVTASGGPSVINSTSIAQLLLVAALSAALAVAVTLVVTHVVGSRRHDVRQPATA